MARTLSPEVREALTEAIDRLAYERGLHEVGLDEICERAGVSKPALYRHFGGRDIILADYLDRRRTLRRHAMNEAIEAAGDNPDERVMALISWVANWITSPEFRGCGFHRAVQQRDEQLEVVLDLTRSQKDWIERRLRAELSPIADDPAGLAAHLFLLIEGALAAGAYRNPKQVAKSLRQCAQAVIATHTS
jgi:AcrR family transcriptional regulator